MRRLAMPMFVLSGAAGLVFEVALQRSLTRAFGVSAFATSTVLAAYMAGLALGALLFGRLVDRSKSPLRLYALLELGIGASAAVLPFVTPAVIEGFSALARGQASNAPAVVLGRLVLAFAVTLGPTLLMGGTLPALARALGATHDVARLYTANLLGAAGGATLAAYAFLPGLGLSGTLWLGGLFNLGAAAIAFGLARRAPAPLEPAPGQPPATRRARSTLLALSGWSGFATFAAEVTWFQLLGVVVGASAWAFGLMLAVFLVGLTLGSAWVSRRDTAGTGWRLLGLLQLGCAVALLVTLPLWERVPSLLSLAGNLVHGFAAQELARAVACVEVMLLPAALLGTVYPVLLRLAARDNAAGTGRAIGGLAAVNTVGAVAGALLTGFVLLPAFGTHGVLVVLIVGCAGVAAVALAGRTRWVAIAVAVGALFLPGWDFARLASGSHVYFEDRPYASNQVLWARESVESGLTTVVRSPRSGTVTLLTNGKFQGNDTGELGAQRAFTQLPMLVQRQWDRALLIGVGTGCSLASLAPQPYREVEAVDLSHDIVEASARYFTAVNDGVFATGRVALRYGDGRNHLLLATQPYDLVSLELTSIWFAGAADLYSREFYQLVKRHLTSSGVLQQWVQLHHLTRRDLAVILNTVHTEFPHVALFYVGGQGIVLASMQPLEMDEARVKALSARLQGTAATAGLPGGDLLSLGQSLVLDTAALEALVAEEAAAAHLPASALVSTDDNLWLEYSTPRGNARDDLDAETLVESLRHLGARPLRRVGGPPAPAPPPDPVSLPEPPPPPAPN